MNCDGVVVPLSNHTTRPIDKVTSYNFSAIIVNYYYLRPDQTDSHSSSSSSDPAPRFQVII